MKNTAYYAVTHIDDLLSRTEEAGVRFLQYYTRRLKQETLDDESINVLNYSMGVLDDLSNIGNFIHDYAEAAINEWFTPDPWREDQVQMIIALLEFLNAHQIAPTATEATLFGNGYAGTADLFGDIDGTPTLADWKTSRAVRESHEAQLAALGACTTWAREVSEGTAGAVHYELKPSVAKHHGGQVDSWWVEEPVPAFSRYAVIQIRPDDWDNAGNFIPAFAKIHEIDYSLIEAGWDLFQAALAARHAQHRRKLALKGKD